MTSAQDSQLNDNKQRQQTPPYSLFVHVQKNKYHYQVRQQFLALIHLYYIWSQSKEQLFHWKTLTKALICYVVYLQVKPGLILKYSQFLRCRVIKGNYPDLKLHTCCYLSLLQAKKIELMEWYSYVYNIQRKLMIVPSPPSHHRRLSWVVILSKVLVKIHFQRWQENFRVCRSRKSLVSYFKLCK